MWFNFHVTIQPYNYLEGEYILERKKGQGAMVAMLEAIALW